MQILIVGLILTKGSHRLIHHADLRCRTQQQGVTIERAAHIIHGVVMKDVVDEGLGKK